MKFDLYRFRLWLYILVVCGLLRSVFFFQHIYQPIGAETSALTFEVRQGQSLTRVVDALEENNIISSGFDLLLFAKLTGQANAIQAGEYNLSGETPASLLQKMIRGDVIYHQLVLVEGWSWRQALRAIQSNVNIRSTLGLNAEQVREAVGLEVHPEGQFFPETYNFSRGTTDREILQQANRLMQEVLEQAWQGRQVGLPYDTPYEALIMASIVEKETAVASERERIAGVFIRRLQQNMRLQTDPTVIYGLGDSFNGNLTRADLRTNTPYNTYMNNGLPPTPIALPGRAAILASMHPDDGDALYFVARGDGTHQFSATLEQHNAAVRQFQTQTGNTVNE